MWSKVSPGVRASGGALQLRTFSKHRASSSFMSNPWIQLAARRCDASASFACRDAMQGQWLTAGDVSCRALFSTLHADLCCLRMSALTAMPVASMSASTRTRGISMRDSGLFRPSLCSPAWLTLEANPLTFQNHSMCTMAIRVNILLAVVATKLNVALLDLEHLEQPHTSVCFYRWHDGNVMHVKALLLIYTHLKSWLQHCVQSQG